MKIKQIMMKDLILGEKKEMRMIKKHKIHILDDKNVLKFKSKGAIYLCKKRKGKFNNKYNNKSKNNLIISII